ncbi:general secretion pathway protein M [Massilia sp. UYP11]|uniref:type II secretion system protein GspM n=1 Tax=Massilia sp. UYP11 TaxID=1756385 RepID=UPI003D19F279
MNVVGTISGLRERATAYWIGRTEQERKFLLIGGLVAALALFYLVLLEPALDGREQLRRSLPELRQQAAQLEALAGEARAVASEPAPAVTPVTRESLGAGMSARGLNPASLSVSGEYTKVQLNNVSFANLMAWLDAQRRESRLMVQDAQFSALAAPGQVDATLTLRQRIEPAS